MSSTSSSSSDSASDAEMEKKHIIIHGPGSGHGTSGDHSSASKNYALQLHRVPEMEEVREERMQMQVGFVVF